MVADHPVTQTINGQGLLSPGVYRCSVLARNEQAVTFMSDRGAHYQEFPLGAPDVDVEQLVRIEVVPHGIVVTRPQGGYKAVRTRYGKVAEDVTEIHQSLPSLLLELSKQQVTLGTTVIREVQDSAGQILYTAETTEPQSTNSQGPTEG